MFPCRRSTVAVDAACPVVALSAGPRGEIACISARRVSIWTCGPQLALIGSVDRQPFELGVLGANVGLCWHPDGTRLAVTHFTIFRGVVFLVFSAPAMRPR